MTTKRDLRRADHGPAARRPWRVRFDSWLPLLIAVIVAVIAILSVVSVAAFSGLKTANRSIDRQILTSLNGCERVQLIRDDTNVVSWGVWNALDFSTQPAQQQAGIPQLLAAVDPATRALIVALISSGIQDRAKFQRIQDEQRYLPPTNCDIAATDPTYRFPQPIPFSRVAACYDPTTNDRPTKPCRHR